MTKKHARWGWLFVSPYVLHLLLFTAMPLVVSIYLSFTRYDLYNPPVWVGLSNYIRVIKDPSTWTAFRNIWFYAIVVQVAVVVLACVLAVLLNQKVKGISAFRVIYYIPGLTPTTAVALVWALMYNPNNGIFNYLLDFIGLGPFDYTYSKNWVEVILSIILMDLWKGVGGSTIYLIAGLQAISNDVMEAADIDGANAWKKFIKITVPLLTPTIFFLCITGIAGNLQAFENFYVLNESTGADVAVVNQLIYNNMWTSFGKVGIAAALGWVSFVFIAIVTYAQKQFENRWVHYE